jgi:PAS domain S-box-containing protein
MSSPAPRENGSEPEEAYAWLKALFDESPLAIGFSRGGVVADANPAYARLFGYGQVAELRGRSLLEQIAPSHRSRIIELLAQRARGDRLPHRYQTRGLRRDGTEFPFEVTTTQVIVADGPLLIAFISDVSEREDALQALKASEERFRTLSAAALTEPCEVTALRTDGSTFLAEIRGTTLSHQGRPTRVATLRDITERIGPRAVAQLDAVSLAAGRAAELCRQMLAYAGKARLSREPVELRALVEGTWSMMEAAVSKKATLERDLAPELATLVGDSTQIRQIVMNLVLNASEAIGGPRGTVRVSTGAGTYDASAFARSVAGGALKAGRYVWFEVRDDGVGMDASTLGQMFDPFFTTKFVGRGLGMASVLGMVRGHGGAIDVESSPGRGTRVRVFFPACPGQAAPSAPALTPQVRGQGVVLVVDDEKNVLLSIDLLLRGFGFEVIVARDGLEAVDAFRARSAEIDVVLLDLTMPRMNGLETLEQLRRIAPAVRVILTSGYGEGPFGGEPRRCEGPDAVLPKPYAAEHLLATIQRLMSK